MKTRRTVDGSWTDGTKVSLMARQTDEWTDGEARPEHRQVGRQDSWVDGETDGWTGS